MIERPLDGDAGSRTLFARDPDRTDAGVTLASAMPPRTAWIAPSLTAALLGLGCGPRFECGVEPSAAAQMERYGAWASEHCQLDRFLAEKADWDAQNAELECDARERALRTWLRSGAASGELEWVTCPEGSRRAWLRVRGEHGELSLVFEEVDGRLRETEDRCGQPTEGAATLDGFVLDDWELEITDAGSSELRLTGTAALDGGHGDRVEIRVSAVETRATPSED